jgi:hypothetical protein
MTTMLDPNVITILVALLINIPTLYLMSTEKRKRQSESEVNFSATDRGNVEDALKLKKEYQADLREMRVDLDASNAALARANALIVELQARDRQREAEMVAMRTEFERDKITRDEVIRALTEKVTSLEKDVRDRDEIIASLQNDLKRRTIETEERDKVILDLQTQITRLQKQQISK